MECDNLNNLNGFVNCISIKENFAADYLYEYLCFEKVYAYKYEHDENILYL